MYAAIFINTVPVTDIAVPLAQRFQEQQESLANANVKRATAVHV